MEEKIYGLIGRKLGHSWSVPIHRALGCKSYRLIELEPEELEAFLARESLAGLNVTIPYKQAVIPFCDHLDPLAEAIGSVNTIVKHSGKLWGYNTDAIGFARMAARAGISFAGKKVLILGAGGASLTVQTVVRQEGAQEVIVVSRRGEENFENIRRHRDAEIIINATPVGMYPHNGEPLIDLALFPHCTGILDLIYNPQRTALLLQAEALGLSHSDGLPMLVEQAVAAEEYFFGKPVDKNASDKILASLRKDFTNLVLIGMPGGGKSTVGRHLAHLSGREVLELDELVEKKAGCSIPEIFAKEGEAAFRALESEVIRAAGSQSGKIIVTGGGAVTREENYAPLHQNGRIYEIRRPLALLSRKGRPLSQNADLLEMQRNRAPLYAKFRDTVIDNNDSSFACAESIWRDFCEHFGSERPQS